MADDDIQHKNLDRKRSKTENLSLRLDPKTKFILEFVARLRGQSITTVVERAIKDSAANVFIQGDENRNWSDYWDANEGVRTLNLLSDAEYPTSFEEDELRSFTEAHWNFFYSAPRAKIPMRAYVEILWPRISTYLAIWRDRKTQDYWAAGNEMAKDLSAAKIAAPAWPLKAEPKPTSPAQRGGPLDDDIPF